MNYLDIDFPEELSQCFCGGPEFSTTISKLANKQEVFNQNWQNPRYKYTLMHKSCSNAIYQKIQNFFLICKGCGTAFNFFDYNDNKIEKQQIGIGDGMTNEFKIYKNYSYGNYTFQRQLFKVKNVKVFVNDSMINEDNFTIKNGYLKFNTDAIPQKNSIVSVDAVFYVIARFDNDFLPTNKKKQSINLPEICIVETNLQDNEF